MDKEVIHISAADAARDFATVLARVCAGAEVIIERDTQPVAVVRPAGPVRRSISECIALAKAHEEETGQSPVLDPDFAADVKAAVESHREPLNPSAWD